MFVKEELNDPNRGEPSADQSSSNKQMQPILSLDHQPSYDQNIDITDSGTYATPYPVQESDSEGV